MWIEKLVIEQLRQKIISLKYNFLSNEYFEMFN